MGRKRRGSQAFSFEQSEETLLQNENVIKLYQNKTFEPPEPKELETIKEEGGEGSGSSKRVKRGESEDGLLVLGRGKARRIIVEYKFWKQDDKEKNRRRKLKIAKQWKGRKRIKVKPLDFKHEQKLIDLIADRVSSDEEEGPDDADSEYLSSQCVWEASSFFVTPLSKHSLSDIVAEELQDSGEPQHTSDCQPQCVSQVQTSPTEYHKVLTDLSDQPSVTEVTNENDGLSELKGLIPESELAELLQCDDFLFCSSKENKSKAGAPPATVSSNSRRSVRRSARIMSVPNLTGSIFTGDEAEQENQENLEPQRGKRRKKAKTSDEKPRGKESTGAPKVMKKKRTKRCTPQPRPGQGRPALTDLSNSQEEPGRGARSKTEEISTEKSSRSLEKSPSEETSGSVKFKRRKSYSLEDGGGRYSLDGSRRNSVLTLSGEREINISMPDSVRRSLSLSSDCNFQLRSLPTLSPVVSKSEQKVSKVGGFISSDEEEVVISGNYIGRKKNKISLKYSRKVY